MRRFYEEKSLTEYYAKYRGVYPKEVADYVINHVMDNKSNSHERRKLECMVEVGCGSGQATNLLAPYFERVTATDVSPNQIKMANQQNAFDHVSYSEGNAEAINAPNASADLLLSAEAAHWFDTTRFFAEAGRVLKPDGTLVLMCYYFPPARPAGGAREPFETQHNEAMRRALQDSTYDREAYAELSALYPNIYAQIPTQDKSSVTFESEKTVSLAVYRVMLRTADSFQSDDVDLVGSFFRLLKEAWGLSESVDETTYMITLRFTFRVIVAKNLKTVQQYNANL